MASLQGSRKLWIAVRCVLDLENDLVRKCSSIIISQGYINCVISSWDLSVSFILQLRYREYVVAVEQKRLGLSGDGDRHTDCIACIKVYSSWESP